MSEVKGAAMELGTERIRKLLVQYAVPGADQRYFPGGFNLSNT